MLLYFFRFFLIITKKWMVDHVPHTLQNSYISIYFGHKKLFLPNLLIIIMGIFKNTETIWNNPISHRFICLLLDVIPFATALSHHYADDAWTSNACHGHNFHCRDLKFSDIVPNTITISNHNFKIYIYI